MNNTMGSYEWKSDTHPVQEVEHWMAIAKQYQAEIAAYKTEVSTLVKTIAASQAREKILREALDNLSITTESNAAIRDKALAQSSDVSVLRNYVASEIRKAAKHIDDEQTLVCFRNVFSYADRYEKGMV